MIGTGGGRKGIAVEVWQAVAMQAPQHYGFALTLDSKLQHELNLNLLQLRESGAMDRIVEGWLGRE
ncbi:MAG: hypothetical protein ABI822_27165 [Bryobacteraceae bacterium]